MNMRALGSDRTVRPSLWDKAHATEGASVESIALRDGMVLMLSRLPPDEAGHFHHVESEDVFGIGFHLRGGADFDMDGTRFSTTPLDVWAGTGPRGSASWFSLPPQGFRTISVRFTPDAARTFFDAYGVNRGPLFDIAREASGRVVATRLSSLDEATAQTAETMLTTCLTGPARRLFLEAGALTLLAAHIGSPLIASAGRRAVRGSVIRERLMKARRLVEENLTAPPSIVALGRLVGLNEFTLKREFKRTFGTTVFGYVRARRMDRAALDLRAGLSVAQAAAAVGYECPRCFADAFRRHHGVLPSEVTRGVLPKLPRTAG